MLKPLLAIEIKVKITTADNRPRSNLTIAKINKVYHKTHSGLLKDPPKGYLQKIQGRYNKRETK